MVSLENKCRVLSKQVKEKKRLRDKLRQDEPVPEKDEALDGPGQQKMVVQSKEDLLLLESEVFQAEKMKKEEEKKLKETLRLQEETIRNLNAEMEQVSKQCKDKDAEYRLNELKLRHLKRQLPPTRIFKKSPMAISTKHLRPPRGQFPLSNSTPSLPQRMALRTPSIIESHSYMEK
jgi:hypothetical protein